MYYVLKGSGRMELDGEWHAVRPGSVVQIDAGTRHRLVGDDGQEVTAVVMAVPAFNPADEHFD